MRIVEHEQERRRQAIGSPLLRRVPAVDEHDRGEDADDDENECDEHLVWSLERSFSLITALRTSVAVDVD